MNSNLIEQYLGLVKERDNITTEYVNLHHELKTKYNITDQDMYEMYRLSQLRKESDCLDDALTIIYMRMSEKDQKKANKLYKEYLGSLSTNLSTKTVDNS